MRDIAEDFPALRPVSSLICVVLAGLAACLLVPQILYHEPGANFVSGLIISLGLLAGVILSTARAPGALLRAENILMIGLLYWLVLDLVQGAYALTANIPREAVVKVLACTVLFAGCLWLGSFATTLIRPWKRPDSTPESDLPPSYLFWAVVVCFVLGSLWIPIACKFSPGCMIALYYPFLFDIPSVTLSDPNSYIDDLVHQFKYISLLTFPLAIALYVVTGRWSARVVITLFLASTQLAMLFTFGGRRFLGTMAGASILIWILMRQRIRVRHLVGVTIVSVFILVLLQLMAAWRHQPGGVAGGLREGRDLDLRERTGIAVDRNFRYFATAVTVIPDVQPHTGIDGFLRPFAFLSPPSLWPERAQILAAATPPLPQYMGLRVRSGFSYSCSIVCDLYMIGGYAAIAVGGFAFGILANLSSRLIVGPPNLRRRLLYAVSIMVLFVGLRTYTQLVLSSLSFLALLALYFVYGLLRDARIVPAGTVRRA